MKDTLIIIGSHPRTREQFDYSRTDCDIWLFNEALSGKNTWAKRADAIFQMHAEAIWRNPANRNDPGHFDWLKTQTVVPVIYMQEVYPEVPASKKYPMEGVLDMLGGDPDHFLTSSVAQAIALGVYLGFYNRVEVYGVAMETNTEYQWQRDGVAFWKGFAMGRGIQFYFADETFRSPIYGMEGEVAIPYETFGERITELAPKVELLNKAYTDAAMRLNETIARFVATDAREGDVFPRVDALIKAGQDLGVLEGARQENQKYKDKADKMRAAAQGEFIFSRQEFESAAANLKKLVDDQKTEMAGIGGQMDMVHQSIIGSAIGSPKREKLFATYRQLLNGYLQCNNRMSVYHGAMQENFAYMARLERGVRAAGGVKSEAVLLEAAHA